MAQLRSMARAVQSAGRNGDTLLAHITPEEARLLKDMGGSGTINPDTGLPEFYGGMGSDTGADIGGALGGVEGAADWGGMQDWGGINTGGDLPALDAEFAVGVHPVDLIGKGGPLDTPDGSVFGSIPGDLYGALFGRSKPAPSMVQLSGDPYGRTLTGGDMPTLNDLSYGVPGMLGGLIGTGKGYGFGPLGELEGRVTAPTLGSFLKSPLAGLGATMLTGSPVGGVFAKTVGAGLTGEDPAKTLGGAMIDTALGPIGDIAALTMDESIGTQLAGMGLEALGTIAPGTPTGTATVQATTPSGPLGNIGPADSGGGFAPIPVTTPIPQYAQAGSSAPLPAPTPATARTYTYNPYLGDMGQYGQTPTPHSFFV